MRFTDLGRKLGRAEVNPLGYELASWWLCERRKRRGLLVSQSLCASLNNHD